MKKHFYPKGLINTRCDFQLGSTPDEWISIAQRANHYYEKGRYGKRRHHPKWIEWRHEWKMHRDAARRFANNTPSSTPRLLKQVVSAVGGGATLVLLIPAAALAIPALAVAALTTFLEKSLDD